MTAAHVRSALQSGEPFTIRLVNGQEFHVAHADFATVSPNGILIAVWCDNGSIQIIATQLVAALTLDEKAGR